MSAISHFLSSCPAFAGCPEDRKNSFKQNEELDIRFFQLPSFLWWVSGVLPTPFLELMRQ